MAGATGVLVTRDVTGDGRNDLLVRQPDGSLAVRPGTASGTFGATSRVIPGFVGKDQVTAPGDLNGDGRTDLAARNPATGALVLFLQRADGSFRHVAVGTQWGSYDRISAAGDLNGDGQPDLVARDASGALWLYAGDGHAGFASAVRIPGRFGALLDDHRWRRLHRRRAPRPPGPGPGHRRHLHPARQRRRHLRPAGSGPSPGSRPAARPAVGNVGGNGTPDVVSVVGGTVRAWVNPGTFDLGRPIDTGVSFAGADRILDVGDWDRDGYADVVTRQASRQPRALARRRARPPRARAGPGHRASAPSAGSPRSAT